MTPPDKGAALLIAAAAMLYRTQRPETLSGLHTVRSGLLGHTTQHDLA